MHFLELLEQVSNRDAAVYYAKNCRSIPQTRSAASKTLLDGNYSFRWDGTAQGHEFWSIIYSKLSEHPQKEKVTYEPEVYYQYKNEVFDSSKSIRDYSILIKNTSIEDRRKLHSLLHCLDEPVFKSTGLSTDYTVRFNYFRWATYEEEWAMADTIGDGKQEIKIQDFISKFSKTKPTTPEDDIKVGTQYTNTTGVICTIWEVHAGSEFDNVIKYKTPKNFGVTNRNNIKKNWKLLVAPTIKVGEVYTNSAGSKCIITEINANGSIRYLHKDGNYYTIGVNVIAANWTKKPAPIESYAIHITDTSLENRLKVRDLLLQLKEPVFLKSRAFSDNSISDKSYLGKLSHEWMIGDEEDIKNKTIITIEEFLDLFVTKQELKGPAKIKPISEVLEEQPKQTKTTKKETFMSKLKTTTLNTLEQNKQAAIIAAKVDAGRIINKQVIKQLKPHVPMLLRGYLDTPLAPVIAANVVAMIGNHTDNSKVKKVGELMLLGAADATVQSFNLDKIIDDVLAGIKLPAGFLDADDN